MSGFPQPHCKSYYAATANITTGYSPLRGAASCDVCIVGAGFTGISAALELAERGYKVTVLEANRVSWGASGRNGGQLIGGISGEERLIKSQDNDITGMIWKMRWAGHEIIRQRVEKYAIDCDLKFGYMDVAIKPRHWRDLLEEYEFLQRPDFPYETRLVPKQEITSVIGTEAYIGGLVNMANGHLHPLNLCLGEAAAAVQQGAVIHEQSPVVRIEYGSKPRVHTEAGSVSCDFVVPWPGMPTTNWNPAD